MEKISRKLSLSKNLVGIAGVYDTAAELTCLGYVALVTIRNTKAYDLLISKEDKRNILPLQVKTRSKGGFRIVKIEDTKKTLFERELDRKITCPFVLVDLKNESPEFFILTEKQMKELILKDWNFWENHHKHYKELRRTNVEIIFQLKETMELLEDYRNKWENLAL